MSSRRQSQSDQWELERRRRPFRTLWMSGMKTEEKMTYDLAVEGLRVKQSNTDLPI